jgi:hypothetical protein
MQFFKQLGDQIERDWRAKDFNEELFPALAAEALRSACLPEKYTAWQVLEWTLEQTELPRQRDVKANFGDPPITVYSAPRFHIDVYFWFQGTTSIHQHAFCGAFQVMHGSSIHSWYEFDLNDKVNVFCEIGEMRLKSCDLLNVGDVQQILPGRQYIHSLFHLDHPSATIVIRTDKSPLYLPQYDYQKPGLALDPFFELDGTTKKLQTVAALFAASRPEAESLVKKWLESADFQTTFAILSQLRNHLGSNDLAQMFGGSETSDRFDSFLELAEQRHGSRAEIFRRVFAYRDRLSDLIRRRNFVDNPEHRFFFALLLNVDGRERIISLIRDRFPDADPIEKILDWAYELSQMRLAGTNNQNALGISPFDDFDLQLVEYLLKGRSDGEIAEIIRQIYPPEKAEHVLPTLEDRTAAIRNSIVFSPLLSGANQNIPVN